MITINSTTVAVESAAELKSVLESNNTITLIYLAKDITLTNGIDILGSKQNITIDGLYPTDGTGTIHTYTDMNSTSTADVIGIRTPSSINITLQNMNVVGRNYYGIIYVSEGTMHQNVVVTYSNITYSGPQITFHPSGLSVYKDLNIKIVASPVAIANEIAETFQLQIGGNTTIVHNSTVDSAFWFRGYTNNPYLEILEGANLTITTTKDLVYTSNPVKITIDKNATFTLNTNYGVFRDSSHQASSILVDENSNFSITQNNTNGGYATIFCRGTFSINKNASLYIQANFINTAPLIRLNTANSSFNVTDPKSVILYNRNQPCFSFESTSAFSISCGKLDYWLISPTLTTTKLLTNNPLYTWYKSPQENILLTATATSARTTVASSNLTTAESALLPNLTLLQLQTANTLRFVYIGSIDMGPVPSVIEFQRPIVNTNPVILGRKDKTITITVQDTRAFSKNWNLYAYINSDLITQDGKHSLPDSLIFVDNNQQIKTLSKTPTLIYAGTSNNGNPKTTTITWSENTGILFKINKPLYNGETYSTTINWNLTDA